MKVMDYNIHVTHNIEQPARHSRDTVVTGRLNTIESYSYDSVLMNLDEMKSFLYLIVGASDLTVIDSSGKSGHNLNARA